jgi:hypothetical protein
MKRLSFSLLATALLALASANTASAGYWYDWSTTTGGTVTLNSTSGNYQMQIFNEPLKPQNPDGTRASALVNSTDTTAATLKILPVHGGKADSFTGEFFLKLVVFDTNGMDNHLAPLTFKIDFHTVIGADGSVTTDTASISPLAGADLTLGSDKFHVGQNKLGAFFLPAPQVGSQNPGAVGMRIDITSGNGGGGGPQGTPEPSTIMLSGIGLAFSGFAAWRKRRMRPEIAA